MTRNGLAYPKKQKEKRSKTSKKADAHSIRFLLIHKKICGKVGRNGVKYYVSGKEWEVIKNSYKVKSYKVVR